MDSHQAKTLDSLTTQRNAIVSKLVEGNWTLNSISRQQRLQSTEGYVFVLQCTPRNKGKRVFTTCRCAECEEPNRIFSPFTFRLSLEKSGKARPPNMLGYRPIAPNKAVMQSASGANQGKRGLGANGEEWWCLRCVETLFKKVRQSELESCPPSSEPPAHAFMHWAQWIIPEERKIPRYPDSFRLKGPYIFALEKWKAVILYDTQQEHGANFKPNLPPHLSIPQQLYEGTDGRSLYLSKEMRDMRGLTADGEEAEVSAAECQDVSLTEVMKRVDRFMGAISTSKRALGLANEKEARAQAQQSPGEVETGVKDDSAVKEDSTVTEKSALEKESSINTTKLPFRPASRQDSM